MWSNYSTPRYISSENKNINLKRYEYPYVHCSITIAKIWKQRKCSSIDEWIKMMCVCVCTYIYTYAYIYILTHIYIYNTHTYAYMMAYKKEWNLAISNNMDRPRGCYAKWNKSDRGRQILYEFTYMWNLKNKKHKWKNIKQKQSYSYREKKLVARRGSVEGEKKEPREIKRYKLPVTK